MDEKMIRKKYKIPPQTIEVGRVTPPNYYSILIKEVV